MNRLLVLLATVIALSLVLGSCGETENNPSQSSESVKSEGVSSVGNGQPSGNDTESTEDDKTDESVDTSEDTADSEADESVDTSESVAVSDTDASVDISDSTDDGEDDSDFDKETVDAIIFQKYKSIIEAMSGIESFAIAFYESSNEIKPLVQIHSTGENPYGIYDYDLYYPIRTSASAEQIGAAFGALYTSFEGDEVVCINPDNEALDMYGLGENDGCYILMAQFSDTEDGHVMRISQLIDGFYYTVSAYGEEYTKLVRVPKSTLDFLGRDDEAVFKWADVSPVFYEYLMKNEEENQPGMSEITVKAGDIKESFTISEDENGNIVATRLDGAEYKGVGEENPFVNFYALLVQYPVPTAFNSMTDEEIFLMLSDNKNAIFELVAKRNDGKMLKYTYFPIGESTDVAIVANEGCVQDSTIVWNDEPRISFNTSISQIDILINSFQELMSKANAPEQPPVDEDEVELNQGIPDGPIDIAVNGVSNYVIVYEAGNPRVEAFTEKFVEYMQKTHKITLEAIGDDQENTNELCIYIGNIKGIKRVKDKMNSENDFGACVFGNDYALYATNDRLYDFLLDALKEKVLFTIRNGNWSTRPGKDFIYSKSDLKDVDYADYVLAKFKNIIDHDYLRTIFEPLSFTASDGTTLPYRLYVPYHYDNTKEYPVLLFLHGAGERGTNNTGNIYHMFKELFLLENSPFWDCIIVAPQCPEGQQWVDTPWAKGEYSVDEVPESNELKAVLELLQTVENEFPTDKDRYYVMGLSMGGFGTWDIIMRHSDIFAAAVPICGGGDSTQAEKLIDMPIYTLHCKDDKDVPFLGTRVMIVALNAYGSTVLKYEELSGYGHNVWGYASKKAEIWTWLFEQTREGR